MKELLPYFLDETTDVDARGNLLLSSLLSGLIDANLAIEISSDLIGHGITERLIHRIVDLSLPEGLDAIARRGALIHDSMRNYDNVNISGQIKAKFRNSGEVYYIPSPDLSTELQALVKQRLVWNAALRESMPNVDKLKEEEIVNPQFLTTHLNAVYFLLDLGPVNTKHDILCMSDLHQAETHANHTATIRTGSKLTAAPAG